jgi:hypothetical protein
LQGEALSSNPGAVQEERGGGGENRHPSVATCSGALLAFVQTQFHRVSSLCLVTPFHISYGAGVLAGKFFILPLFCILSPSPMLLWLSL